MEQDKLDSMIKQEAKELKEAPIVQAVMGQAGRCSICGRFVPTSDLQPYDQHVHALRL